jgi:predicted phosphodiesterase
MKLIVITDVHANLPALQAATEQFISEGYDQIFSLGDAIAIGPFPCECLDLLLSLENIQFVMGNHDDWYTFGLPNPRPAWMSDGEFAHLQWTHAQLGNQYRSIISNWPWCIEQHLDGFRLTFLHYALTKKQKTFKDIIHNPSPDDLDQLFAPTGDLIFYGHTHIASDLQGRARYVTAGSLGCQKASVAPYLVVKIKNGKFEIQQREVSYDDSLLYETFETRQVPERTFIYSAFFGNRFSPS